MQRYDTVYSVIHTLYLSLPEENSGWFDDTSKGEGDFEFPIPLQLTIRKSVILHSSIDRLSSKQ